MIGRNAVNGALDFDFRSPRHSARKPPTELAVPRSTPNSVRWTATLGAVASSASSSLAGGVEATNVQCQALLSSALESCEGYFPAFQFVVWAGKTARTALDAAMFETSGEA